VAISLLSDNAAGDRFRWFVEENSDSECIVWIENIGVKEIPEPLRESFNRVIGAES